MRLINIFETPSSILQDVYLKIKSQSTASVRSPAYEPAVDLWSITQIDGQTGGRMDRCYQVHYLPRFVVNKNVFNSGRSLRKGQLLILLRLTINTDKLP